MKILYKNWTEMIKNTGIGYHSLPVTGVPDTHGEFRPVEASASSGVGRAPRGDAKSQCVWHVCKSSRGIFWTTFALT